MFQATLHFPSDQVAVEFESDYAFTKWLGYLKEHGLATAKLASSQKSIIVFKQAITYIEGEGSINLA